MALSQPSWRVRVEDENWSKREVAERYHRDGSTLTMAARKVDEKMRASEDFRKQVNALILNPADYSTIQP